MEIPVTTVDSLVRDLRVRYRQEGLFRQPREGAATAHVSIARVQTDVEKLSRSLLDRLAAVCASFGRFGFALREVGMFESGAVHLVPTLAAPFRELARRCASIQDERASLEPAPGEPHVTLAFVDGAGFAALRRDVEPLLPLRCQAAEAHVVLLDPDRRTLVGRLALR